MRWNFLYFPEFVTGDHKGSQPGDQSPTFVNANTALGYVLSHRSAPDLPVLTSSSKKSSKTRLPRNSGYVADINKSLGIGFHSSLSSPSGSRLSSSMPSATAELNHGVRPVSFSRSTGDGSSARIGSLCGLRAVE